MDDRFGFFGQSAVAQEAVDPTAVSLWLYLAGLCVTLSGLYAVNFYLGDSNFANLSYGLAIAGYVFSYFIRVRQVDLNAIKMPLMISAALLALAYVSGGGAGWLIPAGAADNRPLELQVMFAWVAILHTFVLMNDASVLFACVPGMTMLALVSTQAPDQEVQNAFLVFVAAATFLMVHENYLRTRNAKTLRKGGIARPLFGGQLLLTGACLLGALLLANVVAVPIQTVGQSLFDANMTPMGDKVTIKKEINAFNVSVNEQTTLNLAMGPVSESDSPLLRITAAHGMYWRGTTFSEYNGNSFNNQLQTADGRTLTGERQESGKVTQTGKFSDAFSPGAFTNNYAYKLPPNQYDLPPADMKNSKEERQKVQVIGGNFSNLYGADTIRQVAAPFAELHYNAAGALLVNVPASTIYEVVSQVPTRDENTLRQASSSLRDVPEALQQAYLQKPVGHVEDMDRLKQLAQTIIKGKTNNFDRAEALRNYIASECKYNLQVTSAPRDRDVVAWFLFDKKEGYCDSFAAAMTMLCRYADIPARLVSGFLPGEVETEGVYMVREKHKHLWTEVFFPHIGWVPFDATDGTIDISDHSNGTKKPQATFVKWLTSHGSLPLALTVMLVAMLGYVVKTEVVDRLRMQRSSLAEAPTRPLTNLQVIEAYAQTEALFKKRGLPRLSSQTPDEYGAQLRRRLASALPAVSQSVYELTALYTVYRYGRDVATLEEAETARKLAASIRDNVQAVNSREFAEMIRE